MVDLSEDLSQCDLDGDGISDDIDPDNTNACIPDPASTACLLQGPATPAPPATPPAPNAAPGVTPVAAVSSPPSSNLPAELAATGVGLEMFAAVGIGALSFGALALVAPRLSWIPARRPRAAHPRVVLVARSRA